jgi:gliding motility-associated-like protein
LIVQAQVAVPFTVRYEENLKGDMTLISNNIVNRQSTTGGPNVPYNLLGAASEFNDNLNMQYIDVDTDASTFSSSSATLGLPASGCSKIVYAGLYWSATYRFNNGYSTSPGDGDNIRTNDFNQVRIKLPGSTTYQNVTGQLIFDGFTNPAFIANSPYACYADITSLVNGLANPEGEYTVANIRATQGFLNGGGVSGGWTIFFVYENPTMTGKLITAYDGFAGVRATIGQTDINFTGFNSLPAPFPVRAKLASAALEGDNRITGDQLLFKAASNATFTPLSNTLNVANNFFNSRLTLNNLDFTTRVPNSLNTLGYDGDLITIANPLNSIIPNNETAATLRITSTQDTYFMFFNAFNIEIIEPDIKLVKTVQDLSGNDIGGAAVNLGQVLEYVITFQNIGNDDGANATIRDILPINTSFLSVDLSAAPGVTYTFDPGNDELLFTLPNNLIQIGDPIYTIKIRVKVAELCNEFEDACSNLIQNQAYTTYQGLLNNNIISDDPSFAGLDSCGFGVFGPSNFIVDLDDCLFESEAFLCGNSITLTAANGYDSYTWFNSLGAVIGTTQSISVSAVGTYTVQNVAISPCLSITQTFNVLLFGTTQTNPVIPFADQVVICPNDGTPLPLIFLCGTGDSQLIQTGISDATSVVWEILNETSCPPVSVANCANNNPLCTWNQVGTGPDFNVTSAGKYRVTIFYQEGCFSRFYFDVFTNLLDIQYTSTNILCTTPGNILITNLPTDYQFQLVDQTTGTILVPYQSNPNFVITTPGIYTVEIIQNGVTNGCVFEVPNIGIQLSNFQVNLIVQNANCNGFGSIRAQVTGAQPQYTYSITSPISLTSGLTIDNDYTFSNLNPGTYTVTVTTEDGCTFTDNVNILDQNNLSLVASVTQSIGCNDGVITVVASGGNPPYSYAIGSINGVPQNPAAGDFQSDNTFIITTPGIYEFIVVDANNCAATSNPVTIAITPDVAYTSAVQNVQCSGAANGSIIYTITTTNGFAVTFQLLDSNGVLIASNNSGIFTNLPAGSYTVNLLQSQGSTSCTFAETFIITAPSAISGTAIITQNYTCITNSGTISVQPGSVTGGTAPYLYSLDGVNFFPAVDFGGLTSGSYTIYIQDANGCIATTNTITLVAPNQLTNASFTATTLTCPAQVATVTVTSIGGTAPFNYQIIAPITLSNGTNPVFAGLTAGTYTFLITDSNGCTYQESYTINPIAPINVTGQLLSNITCFGGSNGSILFNVAAINQYNYSVVASSGTIVAAGTNSNLTVIPVANLAASTYTITITDTVTNCTSTATVIVAGPVSALSLTQTVGPITCLSNGTVVAIATGGWGSYQYTLTLPNASTVGPQTSGTFTNLTLLGAYSIAVADINGCAVSSSFNLTAPSSLTAAIDASSDTCYDTSNASTIIIAVIGGTAPFVYNNGGPNQNSNIFSNLTPGSYTFTVTDSNGCTATVSQTITTQLIGSTSIIKGFDCSVTPDAIIQTIISGGALPFSYQVSFNGGAFGGPIPVVGSVLNLTTAIPGTYQFLFTDAQGCSFTSGVFTINPITNPDITGVVQTQTILCANQASAAITVGINPVVGTPPFTLSVVNTTTGVNYGNQTSGLAAGNYVITLTDANSCTDTASITIAQPSPVAFTIATVDITCSGTGTSFGEIIVQGVTGGTAPYTYTLNNNFGFIAAYNTTANENYTFLILNYGIYNVVVVDANGCSQTVSNIVIASPPNDLTIDVSTSTADCTTGGTAIITVTAAVSSGSYEFGILETNTPPYSTSFQPADVGTPETSTFTGLTPGVTYTFVVHDLVTNCYYFEQSTTPINSPSNLVASLNVVNNVTCTGSANGNVSFTFSNYGPTTTSVTYQLFNSQANTPVGGVGTAAPLTGAPVTVNNFGLLGPGIYYILFTEVGGTLNGCTNASVPFTITQSSSILQVTATVTQNDNCNLNAGQISAVGQFGTPPYQFQLTLAGDPAPTVTTWTGTSSSVFNVEAGTYVVYIKDANNCIQSTPTTITVGADPIPAITASVINQCTANEGGFSIAVVRTVNGVAPYSYSLNGSTFQAQVAANFSYNNLSSGTHTIEINDANGCGNTVTVVILPPLNLNPVVTALPSCANNDGVITVAALGGSGNYQYTLQNNLGVTIQGPQASAIFSGLPAGDFTVVLTDVTSTCNASAPVNLSVPTPVTFTSSFVNVSCNGGSDGSISAILDASNNNPPYTFTLTNGINPPIVQNNGNFTGLVAGTYNLTITSDRGCEGLATFTITEPSLLAISATATAFVCNASNTVQTSLLTVTVLNDLGGNPSGTAPYNYSINGINYFPTNTFTIADNGSVQNITVYVRDTNNCLQTTSVIINPLPTITAAVVNQTTAITCFNPATVLIAVTGGSGDFTYELLPSGPSQVNNPIFTLTAPGSYTFQVTDNVTGCSILTAPFEILPFDTIDVTATAATPVTCFNDSNGTITISTSGYSGPYSYLVLNSVGTTIASGNSNTSTNPFTITGLVAGNHQVQITATATPFCTANSNFIVVESPSAPLALTATQTASVTCTNSAGEINATASGGWGTYQYQLVNNTTATTIQPYGPNSLFVGLAAGNYTVSVQDAGGCISTAIVTLTTPTFISAAITSTNTNLLCFGDTNASVSAIGVTGGQGTFQYILNTYNAAGTVIVSSSGAQTSSTFTGLGVGIYSITITDGWNCGLTTNTLTITQPTPIVASLSLTNTLSCTTLAEVTISATGGTPPYLYSTDGVNFTSTTTYVVGAGTYQYYVTDANNCAAVLTNQVTISPVPALNLNLNLSSATVNCFGESTAAIFANATGGLGNYNYTLLDGANNIIAGPQTSSDFLNLPAGTYVVSVASGDCLAASTPVVITNPQQLLVSAVNVTNVLCFGGEDGSIEVIASGGSGNIQYAISPNLNQFFTNGNFNDLEPGTYSVLVQDQSGCFILLSVDVIEPAELTASVANVVQNLCLGDDDGSFDLVVTGGTAPYFTSLNSQDPANFVQDQLSFSGLAGGLPYFIFVKDANGCETISFVSLDAPVEVTPTAAISYSCLANIPGNTVTVSVNASAVNDVTYSLDGGAYQTSNIFQNLTPGIHTIDVQHTNGCTKPVQVTVDNNLPVTLTVDSTTNILCNGFNTGSITVSSTGGTGTVVYAISPNITTFTSQTVYNNLVAGTYTVVAQDDLGCSTSQTITLTEATPVVIAIDAVTQELCTNDGNASITISVTGGVAPYETSLNNTNSFVANQFTFSNLTGGQTYTIYVRDANNCITSIPVLLDAPVTINPAATVTYSCTNNIPGNTVTVTVNSAIVGDVTYSLDGGTYQSSNVFQNLTPGVHTIEVQHTNGCIQAIQVTIDNNQPVNIVISATADVLCNGGNTGTITLSSTGGTGTILYAISPNLTNFTSQTVYSGLIAGNYTVVAQDGIGCTSSQTVTINQPAAILISTTSITQELCTNDGNASITISITGGVAPYETSLNNTNSFVANQFTFSNLTGGQTYTIYVRDANNCISSIPVVLNAPVTINPIATVAYACANNTPGNTVTISVNFPVLNFVTYSLDGGAYQASNVFQNLTPGSHTVNVQHTNGCIQSVTININTIVPVALAVNSVTNVTCNGTNSGSFSISGSGGNGTILYAVTPNLTVFTSQTVYSGLAAGTYTIIAKDAAGCEATQTVNITQPNAVVINVTATTQELCQGDANASISINISGGVAPYATSLNNTFNFILNQLTFSNLVGGVTYTIFVRDANNCITSIPVTLNPSIAINPTAAISYACLNNVVGNTVTISVNAAVINDVTYSLDGGAYQSSATFTNVAIGTHSVSVLHTNGCLKTVSFTVNPGIPVQGTYVMTPATCFGLANASAVVNATGGTAPYQYAISPNLTNFSSNNTFNNLAAGSYTVIVQDAIGCTFNLIVKVSEPSALTATTANVFQDMCIGDSMGAIELEISGGTLPYSTSLSANSNFVVDQVLFENLTGGQTYTIYVRDANNCQTSITVTLDPFADIQAEVGVDYGCLSNNAENTAIVTVNPAIANVVSYSLDGGTPQSSNTFTNLSEGNHSIAVIHPNGCTEEVSFTVTNITPLAITLAETGLNQFTATTSGGSGIYTYFLNGYNQGSSNVFQIYATGTYTVEVVDSFGCRAEATIAMTFVDIEIPNFFTPNNDGQNDLWTPTNTAGFPDIEIYVHDRYGRKIVQFGANAGWDGKYNGNELPTGDYWYTISLGDGRQIVGNVTLYR